MSFNSSRVVFRLGRQLGLIDGPLVVDGVDLLLEFHQFGDGLATFGCELHGGVIRLRLPAAGQAQQSAVQLFQFVGRRAALPVNLQFAPELRRLDRLPAGILVHRNHDVLGEIEHALQVAGREVQEQPQAAGIGLAEPDVRHGGRKADVAHALPADLGAGYLHAAAVANYAPVANALVLAAEALPVLGGTEEPLAEQPVLFRAERPVVDGFRLGDLAVGPAENLLRRCDGNADRVEIGGRGFRPVCHSYHV